MHSLGAINCPAIQFIAHSDSQLFTVLTYQSFSSILAMLTMHSVFSAIITKRPPIDEVLTDTRRAIICDMFDLKSSEMDLKPFHPGINVYFNDWWDIHYQQCQRQVSVSSYKGLLKIIEYLRNPQATRSSIRAALFKEFPDQESADDAQLDGSIVLAARLFLMLSIGVIKFSSPPGQLVPWTETTIPAALGVAFPYPSGLPQECSRIPKVFTAANLDIIAGIKVCWTSNLADHLSMKEDESSVMLFHHVSFLKLHREAKLLVTVREVDMFPLINYSDILSLDLIEETLSTLALLLPSRDQRTTKWLKKKARQFELDPLVASCGHLPPRIRRIEHFKYWRDRLIILKQAFDDSEPDTVSQWWYDDRKKVQWYTFWVAALVLLLTVVIGMIQCVVGVLQAWIAFKGLH